MTHEQSYREFIEANPIVYDLFKRFAYEGIVSEQRFSIKLLAEKARWESKMGWARDQMGFRWNNNYTSYLARDLMKDIPELEAHLEIRALRSA